MSSPALTLGVLADVAEVLASGKLVIFGEFDTFRAPRWPAKFGPFAAVIRIETESLQSADATISLTLRSDEDPHGYVDTRTRITKWTESTVPDMRRIGLIVKYEPLLITHPGIYRLEIRVDDNIVGRIPLRALNVDAP